MAHIKIQSRNIYNHKRYQTKLGSLAPAEYRALAA
ncbi:IS3 family transposase [Limosilactobacillus ingluviei]